MRYFITLALLILSFSSHGAQVDIQANPQPAYIESTTRGQELNVDFILHNTAKSPLRWIGVELTVLDERGRTVQRDFFDVDSRLHAELGREGRVIEPGKTLLVYNPFHTFPADLAIGELQLRFTFTDVDKMTHTEDLRIKPTRYVTKTALILPLKGHVLVWDGHDYASHHRRTDYSAGLFGLPEVYHTNFQRYGYDLVIVNENGEMSSEAQRSTSAFYQHDPKDNAKFFGFGAEVRAPGAGTVAEMHDGEHDDMHFDGTELHTRETAYGGNYIIIDHGNGEFSWLGHLQQGSLRVQVGQRVKQGEVVARVGASGSSLFPHLHYELRTSAGAGHAEGLLSGFFRLRTAAGSKVLHINTGDIVDSN